MQHFNFHLNSFDKFLPSFRFIELLGVCNHLIFLPLFQGSACFFFFIFYFLIKSQIVNIYRFVDHPVSVTAAQLCHWSAEAASGRYVNCEWDCVPLKLYLWTLKLEPHVIFYKLQNVCLLIVSLIQKCKKCF